MKITGELLKSERINKGLSVQDVALSLKLSSRIINSLEAGQTDELPAKTFVRGFVKSYAQLLRLDADVVLRQFQEEMGTTSPLPKVPPPAAAPPGQKETEAIKAPRPALKHTSQNYANKNPAAPKANMPQDPGKRMMFVMISGAALMLLVLVIGNKISQSLGENPVAQSVPPAKGTMPVSADAAAAPANSADISAPVAADSAPAPTVEAVVAEQSTINTSAPEEGFQKSNGKPVELVLEAKKDTEVFYAKGDSKKFIPLKIQANHVQILRSRVGLYIKASDGGSFKISVDGVDTGPAGASNKEVKLSF